MAESRPIARRFVLGGGLAASAAVATGYTFSTASAQTADAAVEIVDMVMGDPDATVELIEYGSFTCPHCARFHREVYPLLKTNYIETGKIRFIYREIFFDRPGLWAAMIARCGGPERYFGLTELILLRQSEWSRLDNAPSIIDALFAIGRLAGLDDDTMQACIRDEATAKALYAYFQENAGRDEINATPTFMVNGRKIGNGEFSANFETILNELLDG